MIILGINSCTYKSEVCLIDGETSVVIGETNWDSNRDESEKLLPNIENLLKKVKLTLEQIDGIFVVSGPGSFVAIRVAVVIANTLSQNLQIPLYAINTFEFLDNATQCKKKKIIFEAGGKDIYIYNCKTKSFLIGEKPENIDDSFEENESYLEINQFNRDSYNRLSLANVIVNLSKSKKLDILRVENMPLSPNYVKEPAISM